MNQTVSFSYDRESESAFRRWWKGRSFIQQRTIRFCVSMLVMVLCFPLHEMGLFGTRPGPLNPAHLGQALGAMHVQEVHVVLFFIGLFIIALSWSWVYNLASLIAGGRLTCTSSVEGRPCGQRTWRQAGSGKAGLKATAYRCRSGHVTAEAHFHPVRKGRVSYTVAAISAACALIVLFS